MKATRIIIGVLSVTLVLLSIQAFTPFHLHGHAATGTTWHGTWINHPKSLAEAKQLAKAIVTARVVEVKAGPDIVVAVAGEPSGEDRLPTQRVTFEVIRSYKGNLSGTFTLFRTGTDTKYIEGDQPYRLGETHLLFVEPKADEPGTYLVIAPEGRYQVLGDKLAPQSEESFAVALSRAGLVRAEQAIAKD